MKVLVYTLHLCLVLAANTVHADTILNWSRANPKVGGVFTTVAYGSGTYVAAGTDGALFSSSDGNRWIARRAALGMGSRYTDAIYVNGRFLLSGQDASGWHVSVSSDGATWSDTILPLTGNFGANISDSLTYGGGVYVVVIGNVALTSVDGVTWREHAVVPPSLGAHFQQVAYANGVFAALGWIRDWVVYFSMDGGNTWQPSSTTFPPTDFTTLTDIATNGKNFVITGGTSFPTCTCGSSLLYTSSDGDTWTQQNTSSGPAFGLPVIFDGARYLTAGYANGTYSVFSSTDGITWTAGTQITQAIPYRYRLESYAHVVVASAPGNFFAIGGSDLLISTGTDFANWTQVSAATVLPQYLQWIDYENGKYFAGGYGYTVATGAANVILESDDGLNWSQVFSEAVTSGYASAVAYGNAVYLAMDSQGNVLRSTDGMTWSITVTPPADPMSAVTYGNGVFVAYNLACTSSCTGARIYTSPDGNTWTLHDLSALAPNSLSGFAFNGSLFVALAPGNSTGDVILTSTDGTTWTQKATPLPSGVTFTGLTYANGKLMTVGHDSHGNSYMYASSDGIQWNGGQTTGTSGVENPVTYDGTNYYSRSNNANGSVSSDGLNWSPIQSAISMDTFFDISAINGRVYGVGANGDVLVAEPGGPAAAAGNVTTAEGSAVSGQLGISGNSTATLTYGVASYPSHGIIAVDATNGVFTYTPAADYAGSDSFTFTVSDGVVITTAVESISITSTTPPGRGSSSGGGGGLGLPTLTALAALAMRRRRRTPPHPT